MANQSDRIKTVLEKIRDEAQNALKLLAGPDERRSLAWTCANCRHVKHFTRPVSAEVVARCPRCKGAEFLAT